MEIYLWLLIAFGALTALSAILYIPKLIQFSQCFKKPPHKTSAQKRRISIVVPARDESGVIGDLFDSITAQNYDKSYFDVTVIVKDENDPTVELAKKYSAHVVVVSEQSCKGAALDGYFHSLTDKQRDSYDAFVIVDADAVLSPDYVTELNNALENDCDIFMTRKNIKNYFGDKKARSLFCNCAALIYPVLDEMGSAYRTKRKIPVNFCGQGMMVRTAVIREIGGWPYRTLTEDYEMRKDSILRGFSSMYYPYAVIYTEEVVRHRDAWTRRLRWVMGYSQSDNKYNKEIRNKFRKEGVRFSLWYDTFFSIVPIILFIVVDILTALCGIGLSVYYGVTGSALWLPCLLLDAVLPLFLMYFFELCYCLLTMLAYRDALTPLPFGEKLATLLFAPLFNFEYFPIFIHGQLSLLFHIHLGWQKTQRISYKNLRLKYSEFREKRLKRKRKETCEQNGEDAQTALQETSCAVEQSVNDEEAP